MAPYKFLSNICVILDSICARVLIITGNTERIVCSSQRIKMASVGVSMHFLADIKPAFYSALLWFAKSVIVQLKASSALLKARKDFDIVLFYQMYPHYLLPLLSARTLGKRTIEYRGQGTPFTLSLSTLPWRLLRILDPVFLWLLDVISLESSGLLKERTMQRYRHKILPEPLRFIDLSRYVLSKPLSQRENIVGFIGRLTKDKGAADFVNAIPSIARQNADTTFVIGGAGELSDWIIHECRLMRAEHIDIKVTGWISEDLPKCLNELKLLVLPTRYDALPTILIEAIACGTPVVATSVGGIPDLIKEGETGFLLPSGQAECIAETVTRALALPDTELVRIATNAKAAVEEQFSYTATVERFRRIFCQS